MIVKEYYAEGNSVFRDIYMTLFSPMEMDMMDTLFLNTYRNNVLDIEDRIEIETLTSVILRKNEIYYRSIKESYEVTFDPLNTTNLSETHSNTATSKKDETDNDSMNVNKTVTDTGKTVVDKDISHGELSTINKTEGNTVTNNLTDEGLDAKNIETDTSENKSAFDSSLMQPNTQTIGKNSDKVTTNMRKTGTVKTDVNAKDQIQGTKNITDKSKSDNTNTSQIIDNTTHNKSYKTNNTDTDQGLKSMSGYTNADFAKMIADIYETRKINIYDIVLRDIFNAICLPIYEFE